MSISTTANSVVPGVRHTTTDLAMSSGSVHTQIRATSLNAHPIYAARRLASYFRSGVPSHSVGESLVLKSSDEKGRRLSAAECRV